MVLNDGAYMNELDPEGMLEDLGSFPEQCEEAVSIGKNADFPFDLAAFRKVIVTGMGGSGIIGDLLARFADLPVLSNRGYNLPRFVDQRDLLVAISYSGNTEETLSSLTDGVNRGMKAICLTTDGQLEDFCRNRSLPLIKVPTGHQPRASTGYMLFPLMEVFRRYGLMGRLDFDRLIENLGQFRNSWESSVDVANNGPKQLAKKFHGKVPIIYGTKDNTEVVAYRWKTQVNENAKQPAFYNVFPELNHNETVGYELSNDLFGSGKVLTLTNDFELERNDKRMKIMQEIFDSEGISYAVVNAPSGDRFTQILGQIYYGDYFSVYLALLNGVDPSPVRLIEDFKKRLS